MNGSPYYINNDYFEGNFLPIFRVNDEPPEDDKEGRKLFQYFRGKKRMFEFQFQGRFKKEVEGLYDSIYVPLHHIFLLRFTSIVHMEIIQFVSKPP